MSHNDSQEMATPKNTHIRGNDVNSWSGCMSQIIPMVPGHDFPQVHSQLGKRGVPQTNTTIVDMMEPVAEQNTGEMVYDGQV